MRFARAQHNAHLHDVLGLGGSHSHRTSSEYCTQQKWRDGVHSCVGVIVFFFFFFFASPQT